MTATPERQAWDRYQHLVLADPALRCVGCKLVFLALVGYADYADGSNCAPSKLDLALKLGRKPRWIAKHLAHLIRAKLLVPHDLRHLRTQRWAQRLYQFTGHGYTSPLQCNRLSWVALSPQARPVWLARSPKPRPVSWTGEGRQKAMIIRQELDLRQQALSEGEATGGVTGSVDAGASDPFQAEPVTLNRSHIDPSHRPITGIREEDCHLLPPTSEGENASSSRASPPPPAADSGPGATTPEEIEWRPGPPSTHEWHAYVVGAPESICGKYGVRPGQVVRAELPEGARWCRHCGVAVGKAPPPRVVRPPSAGKGKNCWCRGCDPKRERPAQFYRRELDADWLCAECQTRKRAGARALFPATGYGSAASRQSYWEATRNQLRVSGEEEDHGSSE